MKASRQTGLLLMAAVLLAPFAASSKVDDFESPKPTTANRLYIVQLSDSPVVAYTGGLPGLQATAPLRGQKIDPLSPAVVKYAAYLDSKHSSATAAVGGRKVYDYRYTFNGFAAELTQAQAAKLATLPGVLSVDKDVIVHADTSSTPAFLGLAAPGGLWSMVGGSPSNAGENVIIGVIDSGVWPTHLSFSDRTGVNGNATQDGKLSYLQIPGWHGKCVPGEAFTASNCNQKLIGAQYFAESWGGCAGIDAQRPWEFCSARDYNGHGTHTASTSGGNYNVPVTGPAAVFGAISGIAPRARIAAYKALWSTQDGSTASGSTSDLVAAIDQAVADGVDVINFSVSGTQTNFRDPVEISFLYAAQAGIFVAASAGNSGPGDFTVAHPSPWITTVAAGTHNRSTFGTVSLGADTYTGASTAPKAVTAPIINSTSAGLPGADATAVRLCYAAIDNGGVQVLDPAKVAGKIVVCDRGTTARVNKSLAVKEAGGVGMVLTNTSSAQSLNADFHSVPAVHLPDTDRAAVQAYAATVGAMATVAKATIVYNAPAPYTAEFSSRGPLLASGSLLKPDVIAPGQDILAGVSPMTSGAPGLFNLYSGTSMSSPHVAGLAALLKSAHPDWTPMMIKSALMTTGSDVLDGANTSAGVIFRQGAGHVKPNNAVNPGLVFNSGWNDWLGFLCGTQLPTSFCTGSGIPVLNPSDFNSPSIAIAALAGSQTVTRTVTNVGARGAYTVAVAGLAGFSVSVTPASFTLNPGQKQNLQITITRTTATLNEYAGGQITWSDGTHSVRIPVVVNPVALAAPAAVSGTGAPINYGVKFGYTGPFTASARGLIPAVVTADTVADDPSDGSCSLTAPNAKLIPVTILPGTTYARFSLFDADVNPGSDLDLCVYMGTTQVGMSGGGTAAEEVNLLNPDPGAYTVVVQGWGVVGSTPFRLHTWLLGNAATVPTNMTVSAPETATLGQTGAINLSFSGGLTAGTKYLGSVVYGGVDGMPAPTIVRVDTAP